LLISSTAYQLKNLPVHDHGIAKMLKLPLNGLIFQRDHGRLTMSVELKQNLDELKEKLEHLRSYL
jgi:hypothetical protein